VMGIVEKWQNYREQRECYAAVMKRCATIENELNGMLNGFPALAVGHVFSVIRREIASTKPMLVQSVRNGNTYEQIVWLLMTNVIWEELTQAKQTIGLNRLTMIGDGMKALFAFASDALVTCKYHTELEAYQEQKNLDAILQERALR
jgi:hypothetical protein